MVDYVKEFNEAVFESTCPECSKCEVIAFEDLES